MAIEKKPAVKIEPVVEPVDIWEQKRTVYILPEGYGVSEKKLFAVNDVSIMVPVGEPTEVPEPIARRVDIYNEGLKARNKLYAEARAEAQRNERYL